MTFFDSVVRHFSKRGKAMSLYKKGMRKAKAHDHQGAIDDYTMTITMSDTPLDVKAMVLYNRALVHTAVGNDSAAAEDLQSLLWNDEAPANVKTRARQKLARIESRSRKSRA